MEDQPVPPDHGNTANESRNAEPVIISLKKIPAFDGFSDTQYRKIFGICSRHDFPEGHFLCTEGDDSTEFFILLGGELAVVTRGHTILDHISPIRLMGEIGVFTGGKRMASVIAATACTVVRIHKPDILQLMREDLSLTTRLLLNVINDLARKLENSNRLIEEVQCGEAPVIL